MVYATLPELEARWPNMRDDISDEMLLARLDDASIFLSARYVLPNPLSDELKGVLRLIVCNMVRRSLTNLEFEGVSRYAETAGPFSETTSFYSSGDNLYLTRQEEDLLDKAIYGSSKAKSMEMWG